MRIRAYWFAQCAHAVCISTSLHICVPEQCLCVSERCWVGVGTASPWWVHVQSLLGRQDPWQYICAHVCTCFCVQCSEWGVLPQLCVHVWGSSKRTEIAILGPRVITQTRMWSRAPPWGIHMTLEPGLTIADNATGRSEHACPSRSRQHSTGRGRSVEA